MGRRNTLMVVFAVVLLPGQALAGVCFDIVGSPTSHTIVLEITAFAGPYISLVGEDVAPGVCGQGQDSFPLLGAAHLRPDGTAHFGITVMSVQGYTCSPFWVQGTLLPPTFNSGSGFYRDDFDTSVSVTFVPAACPLIPN